MSERLVLQGRLAELRQERTALITGANAEARAIKDKLALLAVASLDEIDDRAVLHHAQELHRLQGKLRKVKDDIEKIKRELGDG